MGRRPRVAHLLICTLLSFPTLCLWGLTSTYKPLKTLWEPMFTELQNSLKQFGLSTHTKKCIFFLKTEKDCIFTELTCTQKVSFMNLCREKVHFLWIKPQLSASCANTLTSLCKHFHVIQSLTSFVSTRLKLLGKITLFPLKNHFAL